MRIFASAQRERAREREREMKKNQMYTKQCVRATIYLQSWCIDSQSGHFAWEREGGAIFVKFFFFLSFRWHFQAKYSRKKLFSGKTIALSLSLHGLCALSLSLSRFRKSRQFWCCPLSAFTHRDLRENWERKTNKAEKTTIPNRKSAKRKNAYEYEWWRCVNGRL